MGRELADHGATGWLAGLHNGHPIETCARSFRASFDGRSDFDQYLDAGIYTDDRAATGDDDDDDRAATDDHDHDTGTGGTDARRGDGSQPLDGAADSVCRVGCAAHSPGDHCMTDGETFLSEAELDEIVYELDIEARALAISYLWVGLILGVCFAVGFYVVLMFGGPLVALTVPVAFVLFGTIAVPRHVRRSLDG